MAQATQGPLYDHAFDTRIRVYRMSRRLLLASGIHFEASPADFKNVCRSMLSNPESVEFFWHAPNEESDTHRGWVMLGFQDMRDRDLAEEELLDFSFCGLQIQIEKPSEEAHRPLASTVQSAAANTPTPTSPTITTTLTAAPIEGAMPTAAPATVPALTTTPTTATSTAVSVSVTPIAPVTATSTTPVVDTGLRWNKEIDEEIYDDEAPPPSDDEDIDYES